MIKPTLTLFLICLVVTAALAFTQGITRDAIANMERMAAEESRTEVLKEADSFEPVDNLGEILRDAVDANAGLRAVAEAYRGFKGSSAVGYVITTVTKGYGGDMKVTVGVDTDGKITGVRIGDSNETPGLGAKVKEKPFISQFLGVKPEAPLGVVKGGKSKPEEIQAVSGATISSRAVVSAVQSALDMAEVLRKTQAVDNPGEINGEAQEAGDLDTEPEEGQSGDGPDSISEEEQSGDEPDSVQEEGQPDGSLAGVPGEEGGLQ